MTENEFLLSDRIQKIQSINEMYDLENKAYISFSGGKDSSVLSKIIDIALSGNKIPRVYINTGIEYKSMVNYVNELQKTDSRIEIIYPKKNIKSTLDEFGYPFKSKEHSTKLSLFQKGLQNKSLQKYLLPVNENSFSCPNLLRYQFTNNFKIKVSSQCCNKLKKEPSTNWSKKNNRPILLTGMRNSEGGQRANIGCTVFEENKLKKFHPLLPLEDSFIDWFINEYDIQLCELYYPPFNFKRTGCKGCPYSLDLQNQLDIMNIYLPSEKKQCEMIWSPIYTEYRRINYRLDKNPSLFD